MQGIYNYIQGRSMFLWYIILQLFCNYYYYYYYYYVHERYFTSRKFNQPTNIFPRYLSLYIISTMTCNFLLILY